MYYSDRLLGPDSYIFRWEDAARIPGLNNVTPISFPNCTAFDSVNAGEDCTSEEDCESVDPGSFPFSTCGASFNPWSLETCFIFDGTDRATPTINSRVISIVAQGQNYSNNLNASGDTSLTYTLLLGEQSPQYAATVQVPGLTIGSTGQMTIPAASTVTLNDQNLAGRPGGDYVFKVRITDADGQCIEQDVMLDVIITDNQVRSITTPDASPTVSLGSTLELTVTATDPDVATSLSISASPLANATLTQVGANPAIATFTFTPSPSQANQTFGVNFTGIDNVAEPLQCVINGQITVPPCVTNEDCNDNANCTTDTCVEDNCVNAPDDSQCDDTFFCNGAEICVPEVGCVSSPFDCDDDIACTDDDCNEDTDSSENVANDAACDDGNDCTADTCDPGSGDPETGCLNAPLAADTECGDLNGSDCNAPDTCDEFGNCLANLDAVGTPCSDDANDCTVDACNGFGSCTHFAVGADLACIDITEDAPPCLEASIGLVDDNISGEITVNTASGPTADTIEFSVLHTDCREFIDPAAGPDSFEFFLNGASLGVFSAEPNNTCTCAAPLNSYVITGAAVSANWNTGGNNTLRFVKTGGNTAFAWVQAQVAAGASASTVCVFDVNGGDCDVPNLCTAEFTFGSVDEMFAFSDPFRSLTPVSSTPFVIGDLPETIDISTLTDGLYVLCVEGDILLGADVAPNPTPFCTCGAGVQTVTITDPAVLSAWLSGGPNILRFAKNDNTPGFGNATAWARAVITSGASETTVCVF